MKSLTTKFFCLLLLCGWGVAVFSQVLPFAECKSDQVRGRLDNFCPRLEGLHLPGCCPEISKSAPIQCWYHVNATKTHYFNSSQTNCVNGVEVTTACCAQAPEPCKDQIVELDFIQRLIKRDGACCFEYCPPADYWRSQPRPDPRLTPQHVLTGKSAPSANCSEPPSNTCTPGLPACGSSDSCPTDVTPSPPSPPPTSPPPDPSPDPDPSPSPSPSPSPPPPSPPPPI